MYPVIMVQTQMTAKCRQAFEVVTLKEWFMLRFQMEMYYFQ